MKILVLPGDGIGPEISQATLTVLDRANALFKLGLEWQRDEIGFVTLKKEGTTLPPRVRSILGLRSWPGAHLIGLASIRILRRALGRSPSLLLALRRVDAQLSEESAS